MKMGCGGFGLVQRSGRWHLEELGTIISVVINVVAGVDLLSLRLTSVLPF